MTVTSAQIALGTTPTLLADAGDADLVRVRIRNSDATAIAYLGGAGVTTANGLGLPAGSAFDYELRRSDVLYGVAVVTGAVHVLKAAGA